ncbi:choline/glycine/proline betaine transport protein [Pseudidiomarina maritima]|jgi:choline/glycine/proline betaine transport protein|uniref:Choline/glycine/proline betaine transport protein n=1 Tax=Pseudidiomarina maritima TaxID=519453 RepID=A0A1I6G3D2_9GAMM|nr:choline BCCT transporter BetT [Pseudidiomarina maritima]SFR36620.1 choline/glycine/proline betaine transport protein [Pseudidiomarina maritima]
MNDTNAPAKLNPPVFYSAAGLIILILLFAAVVPETADAVFQSVQAAIIENGSWFYVLAVAIILISVLYLGFSKMGAIKLGPDHSAPDYSKISWFSMLFSAGMGIGLMFFGVAEPVMHFLAPPVAEAGSVEAAREAMKITFFHWGLHAWAIYAIVALILAFFAYRHGLPLTLRSALYPLIGDKIYGPIGHIVDVFAVIGTVFGVATSLGYGVTQINAGINYLFDIPVSDTVQILLIIGVTLLAVISVTTGLDKGIRRLSELNMILAVLLLVFVLLLGPTVFLLQAFVQNTGSYVSELVNNTFNLFAYEKTDWIGGWTVFYWGWWLSWAPFVGLFIARVSRGRTIREFVLGVLLVPAGFTLMWMTFFGNSAIDMILNKGVTSLGEMVEKDVSIALFAFLEQFPWSGFLSLVATLMVVVFFVTSSDSGSMVVDMLCSNGRDDTPAWQRIFWASGEGIVAIILLLAGGLGALQTMTIASALPFTIILLIATYGLIRALRVDVHKKETLQNNYLTASSQSNKNWRERLHNIIDFPSKSVGQRFLLQVVEPAFKDVAEEMEASGLTVTLQVEDKNLKTFRVVHGDEIDFIYQVELASHIQPAFIYAEGEQEDAPEEQKYYRAEVHLREGGQDYDILGWSRDAVIGDIIDHYHKHMHFLHVLR